jgi:hypothetical protein
MPVSSLQQIEGNNQRLEYTKFEHFFKIISTLIKLDANCREVGRNLY